MVQINFASREVSCKIVYYGPGMSGKTTNLEAVHRRAPEGHRGDLTSIATEGDRTLFFDFMPLDLGTIAGMKTKFQLYTVPGQTYYNSTRKLVLQGVDGVIFVADSSPAKKDENVVSFANLEENLREYGRELSDLPHIVQFNKRDLPDAMPASEMNRAINRRGAPVFEAVATTGEGVFPTLKALAGMVLENINRTDARPWTEPTPVGAAAAPAASPARPAPVFPTPTRVATAAVAPSASPLAPPTGLPGAAAPGRTYAPAAASPAPATRFSKYGLPSEPGPRWDEGAAVATGTPFEPAVAVVPPPVAPPSVPPMGTGGGASSAASPVPFVTSASPGRESPPMFGRAPAEGSRFGTAPARPPVRAAAPVRPAAVVKNAAPSRFSSAPAPVARRAGGSSNMVYGIVFGVLATAAAFAVFLLLR